MGVSVSETAPDIRIATVMVTANSCSIRPSIPAIKRTGMKTATRERVMEMIVNPISLEPRKAASIGFSPCSIWRTIFSSMTIASSTTKPTDRVSAISVILLTENPKPYMAANVPIMESGRARLGITVAERLRRKRKITRITRAIVSSRVNFTSETDALIDSERSKRVFNWTDAGSWLRKIGTCFLILSTTSMVLVPGWR